MRIKSKLKLFQRQKVLLALLQVFGGKLNSIDFQKYLFLFTTKCQQDKSYDFVPYKYGCFSFQSYADRRRLTEIGALLPADGWQLNNEDDFLSMLDGETHKKIELFHQKYADTKGNQLIREVYLNYPYYATRSEIVQKLLSDDEMISVEAEIPTQTDYCFFTIGYEGKSFENYLNRLIRNNVKTLCDVRRNPLSRKYGFSKRTLSDTLAKLDIEYVHIPELGIVSEKRQNLKTQRDYDKLFNEYEKTTLENNEEAIDKLFQIFRDRKRVAITCFEAEHCMCHRGRVAKAMSELSEWDYPIQHI